MTHNKDRAYWAARHREVPGIRAVGCRTKSDEENEREYATAAERLRFYIRRDLSLKERASVLDAGYGQGHHANVAASEGFQTYLGLDLAAPAPPPRATVPRKGYAYRTAVDIGAPLHLGTRFDLVLALDVLFHITDEARFEAAIDNLRRHAARFVYVTGVFENPLPNAPTARTAPHVRHRPLQRFSRLGKLVAVCPWRDTHLARFRV